MVWSERWVKFVFFSGFLVFIDFLFLPSPTSLILLPSIDVNIYPL